MGAERDVEKIEWKASVLVCWKHTIFIGKYFKECFFLMPQSIYSQSNIILLHFTELQDFRRDEEDDLVVLHFKMRNQVSEKLNSL